MARPRPRCLVPRPLPARPAQSSRARFVAPSTSNCGSIALTDTMVACRVGLDHPDRVGARGQTGRRVCERKRVQRSQRRRVDPRDGLIIQVRDPYRPGTEHDRRRAGVPTGADPTTVLVRGSITATEFAGTRTEPAPEPDSLTAAAISAASRIDARGRDQPPAATGSTQPRAGGGGWTLGAEGRASGLVPGSPARAPASAGRARGPSCVDHRPPRLAVVLERVGLAAGAVQRQHQLARAAARATDARHERLELPHQPRLLPGREVGVDPVLERLKARLLQPRDLSSARTAHTQNRPAAGRATAPTPHRAARPPAAVTGLRAGARPSAASASNRSESTWPRLGLQASIRARG